MTSKESDRLYAAYGSNLNFDDLRRWCAQEDHPDIREQLVPVSRAFVLNHELAFDHCSKSRGSRALNLRHRPDAVAEVMLFSATQEAWTVLDQKEGVGKDGKKGSYRRKAACAVLPDGSDLEVITYVTCDPIKGPHEAPSKEYLDIVAAGREAWGLGNAELHAAARGEADHSDMISGVFVYGTLLRDESRFECVRPFGLECALLAHAPGRLVDCGAWPGMIAPEASDDWVQGEFFRFREIGDALKCLDEIEGFRGHLSRDSLFRRTLLTVDVGDGRLRRAWTYVLEAGRDDAIPIPSGDWRAHRGNRGAFLTKLAAAHARAVGGQEAIASQLAREIPFSMGGPAAEVKAGLLPLDRALAEVALSERRLAQVSGQWAMVP